MGNGNSKE